MFEHSRILAALSLAALTLIACDNQQNAEKAPPMNNAQDTQSEELANNQATEDPFLWLEEVEGEEALAWVIKQNERSLKILQGDERYQPMFDAASAILNSDERITSASLRGAYAYNFWQDEDNVRGLWRRMPIADYKAGKEDWETILDIDKLAEEEGENWVYKGSDCLEPEYNRCILTLSRGGSDASVRREFDIASASFVEDGFVLPQAKASTAWVDQDTLLIAYPANEGEITQSGYPRTVRLWQRGEDPAKNAPLIKVAVEDVAVWPYAGKSHGKTFVGLIHSKTFFESEYFLVDPENGTLSALPLPEKSELQGLSLGQMIFTLQQDWQHGEAQFKTGSVIAYDPESDKANLIFAPANRQAVNSVATAEDMVYINLLDNIVGKAYRYRLAEEGNGQWVGEKINLPDAGVVSVSSVNHDNGEALLYFENPTTPESLYFVEADSNQPQLLQSSPAFFDATGMVTRQYEATSKDGTKVPYFVTAKQSVLDAGPAPTMQYGYGGFQIAITPGYSAINGKLWLENGGVWVLSNIRGGGEFGPEWHQAALKHNRQKAYDDFFAIAEDLIAKGITDADHLGAVGRSNGGLLMGVAFTQRPDLYKAIDIGVPLLDMLRYDKLLAGASWVGEYGDPDIPEDRAVLETFSPYQNLEADKDYPVPFFYTSTKDDRVHPGHARKMAAKLEAMGKDFLYYENIEGGHAGSANQDQLAKRLALEYVYYSRMLMDE